MTADDRGYGGSRFSDVVDALFANPYQRVWGGEGQAPLPVREVRLRSVVGGILPFAAPDLFRKGERAIDSGADLRWRPIAPDTTASRRGAGAALLLMIGIVFGRVDKEPSIRQLYPIAELGQRRFGHPLQQPDLARGP